MMKINKQISQIQFLKNLQRNMLEVKIHALQQKQNQLYTQISEQKQNIENNKFEHKHYIKKFYSNIKNTAKFDSKTMGDFEFGLNKYIAIDQRLTNYLIKLNQDSTILQKEKKILEDKIKQLIRKQEKYQYLMDTIEYEKDNAQA